MNESKSLEDLQKALEDFLDRTLSVTTFSERRKLRVLFSAFLKDNVIIPRGQFEIWIELEQTPFKARIYDKLKTLLEASK